MLRVDSRKRPTIELAATMSCNDELVAADRVKTLTADDIGNDHWKRALESLQHLHSISFSFLNEKQQRVKLGSSFPDWI